LEALIQSSRGCIFTTPLFGNPAVAALSLGHLCRPIHVVADIPAMPRFDIWRRALCPSPMIELVARRDAARRLPDILGRGGSIFLLTADHRSSGLAVATEFLGRPIRCRPTPGRLAAWYDAPVVVVTCKRRPAAWRFTFDVHDVIDPRARSDGASAITLRALRAAEKAIRAAPEQYLWALPGERPRTGGAVTDTEIESASYPRRNQTTMAWRRPSMAGRRRRGRAAATVHVPMA
jgi:lauroyl/myristoyl acyltransferase